MVFARERPQLTCRQSLRRLQPPDSNRGHRDLRGRPEEPSLAQLFPRPFLRKAGKRRPRIPPDVCGNNVRLKSAQVAENHHSWLVSADFANISALSRLIRLLEH